MTSYILENPVLLVKIDPRIPKARQHLIKSWFSAFVLVFRKRMRNNFLFLFFSFCFIVWRPIIIILLDCKLKFLEIILFLLI